MLGCHCPHSTLLMKNFTHFINELASQYDFPELLKAPPTELPNGNIEFLAEARTRGQWAIITTTVAIKVKISPHELAAGVLSATVSLAYSHTSGGSNGYSEEFLLCFEQQRECSGREAEYLGSSRMTVFSRLQSAFHYWREKDKVAATEVKRGGDPV